MKTIEKLRKVDTTNEVVKKDGNLTKFAIAAIKDFRNRDGKFYITYTSGSGRFTTNLSNSSVITICQKLGYKFKMLNDSPRGGKTGDYIKVSKKAFENIKSLVS